MEISVYWKYENNADVTQTIMELFFKYELQIENSFNIHICNI